MTDEERQLYELQCERAYYWRELFAAHFSFQEYKYTMLRTGFRGCLHYMVLSQKKRHMNKCLDSVYRLECRYLGLEAQDK